MKSYYPETNLRCLQSKLSEEPQPKQRRDVGEILSIRGLTIERETGVKNVIDRKENYN